MYASDVIICFICILLISILIRTIYNACRRGITGKGEEHKREFPFIEQLGKDKFRYSLSFRGEYTALTSQKGAKQLNNILEMSKKAMARLGKNFDRSDMAKTDVMYKSHIPNKVHTWPYEFYDDPRFGYAYIRYKTFQRYPEVYNLVDRAMSGNSNSIKRIKNNVKRGKPIRVVLIGGGPGYTTQSVIDALSKYGSPKIVCLNTDGSDMLGSVSDIYGAKFENIKFENVKRLMEVCDGADIIINSFAIEYFNDKLFIFSDILKKTPTALILINCASTRGRYMTEFYKMSSSTFRVTSLLSRNDMRQFMLSTERPGKINTNNVLYPNVPYDIGKKSNRR